MFLLEIVAFGVVSSLILCQINGEELVMRMPSVKAENVSMNNII